MTTFTNRFGDIFFVSVSIPEIVPSHLKGHPVSKVEHFFLAILRWLFHHALLEPTSELVGKAQQMYILSEAKFSWLQEGYFFLVPFHQSRKGMLGKFGGCFRS